MKKILLLLFIVIGLNSCSLDDDNSTDYYFEFIPIESVVIPESFVLDETYIIDITYYRPSTCHAFHDLYYESEGNERTVAAMNIVYESSNCENLTDELFETSFDFIALYDQTYVFKFWQGEDANGDDIFLIYEVPVVE